MQVDIKELIKATGKDATVYPGKKLVIPYQQPGEFKSHNVCLDWRSSDTLRVELKAGLSGKTLEAAELSKYPVSFQAPTYFEITVDDNTDMKEE